MLDRHKNAIQFDDELIFIKDNEDSLNEEEKRRFYHFLGDLLGAEVELHNIYILLSLRTGKCIK